MNIKRMLGVFSLFLISLNVLANKPENVSTEDFGRVQIHTFHGISNSHIIETENALFMIDAQMLFKHADQLKQYVESLGKPMKKIVLSHNHPDHWFGSVHFTGMAPIVSSRNVSNDLKTG